MQRLPCSCASKSKTKAAGIPSCSVESVKMPFPCFSKRKRSAWLGKRLHIGSGDKDCSTVLNCDCFIWNVRERCRPGSAATWSSVVLWGVFSQCYGLRYEYENDVNHMTLTVIRSQPSRTPGWGFDQHTRTPSSSRMLGQDTLASLFKALGVPLESFFSEKGSAVRLAIITCFQTKACWGQ